MTNIKKAAAVLISAVFAVMLCILPAGAAVDENNTIRHAYSNRTYRVNLPSAELPINFRIDASDDGFLKLSFIGATDRVRIVLCDTDGTKVSPERVQVSSGEYVTSTSEIVRSSDNLTGNAVLSYRIEKGSYLLIFERTSPEGDSQFRFKPVYPSDKDTSEIPLSTTVTTFTTTTVTSPEYSEIKTDTHTQVYYKDEPKKEAERPAAGQLPEDGIMIYLEPGTKLSLGAFAGGKESSAEWSSSDSGIVSVSANGRITAVSEGTAVITGKKGKTVVNLIVKVEK